VVVGLSGGVETGQKLPIYEVEEEIVLALGRPTMARLVLEAPTGSGKSTQLPQIMLDRGLVVEGEIVVLQPRRIAARMLARRVAAERGGRPGGEIGYQVRFDRVAGRETRVRYVTEGVLQRQLLEDPQLRGVGAIVFDEFHERHLHGDVMLALALSLQGGERPDLKLVVMSATLDSGRLETHLEPCDVVRSEGRTFPVEIRHLKGRSKANSGVWDAVVGAVRDEVLGKDLLGDVLVFLPGAYEIRRTMEALRRVGGLGDWDVLPLYGDLSPAAQDAALERSGRRKIVVATNVAETSLTIDGVRVVIDSGLARVADFDPRRGINTLTIQKISRASAEQRAGRAGRTAPGVCLRLWSERDHLGRAAAQAPEVQRLELSETLLALAAAGCEVDAMRWLDPPGAQARQRAETLLADLGAIGRDGVITATGRRMVAFPAHPRFARMLVEAEQMGCVPEAALCAALCQGRDLFVRGRRGAAAEFAGPEDMSDFLPLLRAWGFAKRAGFDVSKCDAYAINATAAREAGAVMGQLLKVADRLGMRVGQPGENVSAEALAKVVLSGFSDNVARRLSTGTLSCEVVGGRRGKIHKESIAAASEVMVATEIIEIEGREVSVTLSRATGLRIDWLRDLFPEDFVDGEACRFDSTTRRVVNERRVSFRDLVLERRVSGEAPKDRAAEVLADEVVAGNLVLKGWDGRCDSWLARVECLRQHLPDYEFPEFTEDDRRLVVAEICYGARGYKEIKDRPAWPALRKWLSDAQTRLVEQLAPERLTLSNGREAKVTYLSGEPTIAMVLQRLYDVDRTPAVGAGKIPVVVEILGPNRRPVQRTRDLGGFWANSYPEVRKQLKGRYPKHEWR